MKKVFNQTVRDLKREVNKKVLKIPGIEQKILDATNNEPWGPHGTLLADIAQATRNYHEYQKIMVVIWKRINDTGKNWRHVYKALSVLEYLAAHGSERVIDEIREHSHQISTLSDFQYIDSSGKDQGSNVRRKSQSLVALVNDKDRIQEVRQKAHTNREKYRNIFTTGGMHQPTGPYGDDEHCDGHHGNRDDSRNGHGKERDNRDMNNRGGDQNSTGSDEHGDKDGYRDDEYMGNRGNDHSHFGSRGQRIDGDRVHSYEGHQHSPRQLECKYSEKSPGAPPSYEEAMGENQNHVQDERDRERVQSPPPKETSPPSSNTSSPVNVNHGEIQPESGSALSHIDKQANAFDEFDPRSSLPAAAPAGTSYEADIFGLSLLDPIASLDLVPVAADATSAVDIPNNLDPGTNSGTTSSAGVFNQISDDPFGDSPFMAISQDNNSLGEQQNLSLGTSIQLQPGSVGDLGAPQPVGQEMQSIASFDFGDSFYTTPNAMNHQVPSLTLECLPPGLAAPLQDTVAPASIVPHNPFETGTPTTTEPTPTNILSQPDPSASQAFAVSYPSQNQTGFSTPIYPQASPYSLPPWGSAAPPPVSQSFPPNHLSQQGQSAPADTQANLPIVHSESGFSVSISSQTVPSSMSSQPGLSSPLTSLTVPSTVLSQSGLSAFGDSQPAAPVTTGLLAKPPQQKFETKSTVWADTLSRGLVDLNISGPKTNPLADIGVDFDSINRMEKRKEKEKISAPPPVSTITMGKAMGSGSGMGLVGASGLAPPPNPMMGSGMGMGMNMGNANMGMGMGMGGGYGGGMNQQMGMGGAGMGMNMGMGMGMNMGMGMGQGAPMQPPNGMGMPTGPAMPGYGYNPMMGMGGSGGYGPPQQQQYGGYR